MRSDHFRSNCAIWAIAAHGRRKKAWVEAGMPKGREPALRLRNSRLEPRWVYHLQSEFYDHLEGRMVIEQFVPVDKRPLPPHLLWKSLWCKGYVKRGDAPSDFDHVALDEAPQPILMEGD